MALMNILFVSFVISATVIKADCLTGTVKELQTQVQKLFDTTNEINSKLDDVKGCTCTKFQDRVFHVSDGRYTYNFEDAKKACIDRDAVIATLAQLQAAWKLGLDACLAGWLADGSVRYPIQMPRVGCAPNSPAGIRSWGFKPKDKKSADVYCYKA